MEVDADSPIDPFMQPISPVDESTLSDEDIDKSDSRCDTDTREIESIPQENGNEIEEDSPESSPDQPQSPKLNSIDGSNRDDHYAEVELMLKCNTEIEEDEEALSNNAEEKKSVQNEQKASKSGADIKSIQSADDNHSIAPSSSSTSSSKRRKRKIPLPKEGDGLERRILDPSLITVPRKPNEGVKPLFDREEIKKSFSDLREDPYNEQRLFLKKKRLGTGHSINHNGPLRLTINVAKVLSQNARPQVWTLSERFKYLREKISTETPKTTSSVKLKTQIEALHNRPSSLSRSGGRTTSDQLPTVRSTNHISSTDLRYELEKRRHSSKSDLKSVSVYSGSSRSNDLAYVRDSHPHFELKTEQFYYERTLRSRLDYYDQYAHGSIHDSSMSRAYPSHGRHLSPGSSRSPPSQRYEYAEAYSRFPMNNNHSRAYDDRHYNQGRSQRNDREDEELRGTPHSLTRRRERFDAMKRSIEEHFPSHIGPLDADAKRLRRDAGSHDSLNHKQKRSLLPRAYISTAPRSRANSSINSQTRTRAHCTASPKRWEHDLYQDSDEELDIPRRGGATVTPKS